MYGCVCVQYRRMNLAIAQFHSNTHLAADPSFVQHPVTHHPVRLPVRLAVRLPAPGSVSGVIYDLTSRLVLQNNQTGTNVTSFIQNHLRPIQMRF